jgi:hypothetical protein
MPLDLKLFATVFVVIFVAELPDKTALAALVLATRYRPLPVFLGAALALTVQSVVAVAAGGLLSLLPAEVADAFVYAANCHCSNCRRATGSAFKAFAGIEREKLGITRGDSNLMIFGDENGHDARCRVCGSLLYSVVRDGAFVHVALGTLVDDPTVRPTRHIFVGSKAPRVGSPKPIPWRSGPLGSPGPAPVTSRSVRDNLPA